MKIWTLILLSVSLNASAQGFIHGVGIGGYPLWMGPVDVIHATVKRDADKDAAKKCQGPAERVSEYDIQEEMLRSRPGYVAVTISAKYECLN